MTTGEKKAKAELVPKERDHLTMGKPGGALSLKQTWEKLMQRQDLHASSTLRMVVYRTSSRSRIPAGNFLWEIHGQMPSAFHQPTRRSFSEGESTHLPPVTTHKLHINYTRGRWKLHQSLYVQTMHKHLVKLPSSPMSDSHLCLNIY